MHIYVARQRPLYRVVDRLKALAWCGMLLFESPLTRRSFFLLWRCASKSCDAEQQIPCEYGLQCVLYAAQNGAITAEHS